MEETDSTIPLKKLSPFAVSKGIQGIAGEPKNVKSIARGLLIEVEKKAHAVNLLKATMLVNVPIKVTAHRTLNTRKGVIRCRELAGMEEEEIQRELSKQKVVHVKRIFIDKGRKPTNTYILTFGTVELPTSIKAGYINIRVTEYIPNPLRCFRCQGYGHGASRCNREQRCSRCAENHSVDECSFETPVQCANCTDNNDHAASDRKCPAYIKEQLVQKIKHSENISFPEARKRVEAVTSHSSSYATAVKSTPQVSVASIATQTDITWPRNQKTPSVVNTSTNRTSETPTQTPSLSESLQSTQPRKSRQSANKSKVEKEKSNMPPKESTSKAGNRFQPLEQMDTEDVHTSPPQGRNRSRSPIKPP